MAATDTVVPPETATAPGNEPPTAADAHKGSPVAAMPSPVPSLAPAPRSNAESSGGGPAAPVNTGVTPPPAEVAGAVIMDEVSGALLYEVNAHHRLPPASLTKIMTAAVALESLDPGKLIATQPDPDAEWLADASTMGLQPGDHFTVRDLLYGMMMVSGNDAAKELARAAAGSEATFVSRMNALANRLGMRNTHFTDVHGLGGPQHYSSAYDLALLAKHAMGTPQFRQVVGTESLTVTGTRSIDLYNHNPLLNYTPGVTGVKTGFTEEAGNTFVVTVERDGRRIILVMLNAPDRAFDAIDLIEWAFANHTWP